MSSPYDNECIDEVGSCGYSKEQCGSSGSESSSTEEEERLRRLFQACDRDGDGYIDSQDLSQMCQLLNMEEAMDEIMQQLGMDATGQRISFDDFAQCRMRLLGEIEQEQICDDGLGIHLGAPQGPSRTLPGISHLLLPGSSDNSLGLAAGSQDYDSGARDVSPERPTLFKLLESHQPQQLEQYLAECDVHPNILDYANSLHLAALTSLKGEIIDLNSRLQHLASEKDLLEKQLAKQQTEKLRQQRECEERLEHQSQRHEDRVTELHSVIAELRKKIDRNQISVIREEDEYEDSEGGHESLRSNEPSINENNANESQTASLAELGVELNEELSRVVSELECAIEEGKKTSSRTAPTTEDADVTSTRSSPDRLENETHDKAVQVEWDVPSDVPPLTCNMGELGELTTAMSPASYPAQLPDMAPQASNQLQWNHTQEENAELHAQVGSQEMELNKLRAQTGSLREERDRLKRRVRELQTRVQSVEASSPLHSRTSTPTKHSASASLHGTPVKGSVDATHPSTPVAKMAELKKLKTGVTDRHVTGAEISSLGLPNPKVAEHLAQSLTECSNVQEVIQTVYSCGNQISENKIREFEIEQERLQSRIDHLQSQNDLLNLTLEESKMHCNHMSVLMGKYESNNTAMSLAVKCSDQTVEGYDALVALLDTELRVLLANCRAAGLGSSTGSSSCPDSGIEQEEVSTVLQRAHSARRAAEHDAKQLLHRVELDTGYGVAVIMTTCPWEDLSSNSHTASTTSSTGSSADTEWTKLDEQKLRDALQALRSERALVGATVAHLESVHLDPLGYEPSQPNPNLQRLDLENAVLMQELMALKEHNAELKAQNYLMEKEKSSLELHLSGKESQEQAYIVQIKNLKTEIRDQRDSSSSNGSRYKDDPNDPGTPSLTLADLRSHDATQIAQDLHDALKREKRLKSRVQELMVTLEKLSRNSEVRHQQSTEFVNDLKRANSALISAFEKAKRKYQNKVRKLENQIQTITEQYDKQLQAMQTRISLLEHHEPVRPPTSETSL